MKAENIRAYILIRFKLGIEPRTIHQELEKAVRAHAPCLKTIYNWVSEFKKKKCSLANKPRPGRPITEATPANIERVRALIDDDRYIGYSHIEAETSLSYGTIFKIINENLKMKKIASRWVPHDLTEGQKMKRVQLCKENLAMIKEEKWRLSDIITGDESWFYHRHIAKRESNKTWVYEGEKPKTVVRRDRFEPKTMFSFFSKEVVWCI